MATPTPLEALGGPLFHAVEGDSAIDAPTPRLVEAVRTRVRSLEGMQKEALVTNHRTGRTWRLASDEGPYLDGADVAPAPLAFMTTGMVGAFATRLGSLATTRGIELDEVTLVLDSFYTMTGSALRGDMAGGALPPVLEAQVAADVDNATLEALVTDAVATAPVTGLLRGNLESSFALTHNGTALEPDRVAALDGPRLEDPRPRFERLARDVAQPDRPLLVHTGRTTEPFPGDRERYTGGTGSSLAESQDRVLHLRGTGTRATDGLVDVEVKLYSPRGSVFELRVGDPGSDARGRAPDPLSYVSAGLGFCFMTQLGRYATIVDRPLPAYRVVQDTHFGAGDPATGSAPAAEPVETHVFLDSPADVAFARTTLDMSEQTCFLHALCRTPLEPTVEVRAT